VQEIQYYIRVRGKVMGPLGLHQLKTLRDRGQFRRFHEVSEDGTRWMPASLLSDLFPSSAAGKDQISQPASLERGDSQPASPANAGNVAKVPAQSPAEWYYMDPDENRQGPVSKEKFLALVQTRAINDKTPVWKNGMADWETAGSVKELDLSSCVQESRPGKKGVSGLAVTALVLSILWLGGVGSVLAIFFSIAALVQIKRNPGSYKGQTIAVSGLTIGCLLLAITPVAALYYLGAYPFRAARVTYLSASASPQEITEAYRARVYSIKTDTTRGSGILISSSRSRGLIVTNNHVIAHIIEEKPESKRAIAQSTVNDFLVAAKIPIKVLVKNPEQLNYGEARWVAFHRDFDLALLITELDPNSSSTVRVVRQKSLKQGEPAVALGNPQGLEFFTSSGVISSTSGEGGCIWTTCPLSSGNSGGPLILSRRGLLAGINTKVFLAQKRDVAQNLNMAIPAEEIVASLRSGRTDNWIWTAPDLKNLTLELAEALQIED
jgi:S1-C subfamily serine protease